MSNESPLRVLRSTEDASVNFVEEALVGFIESRFVRRCEDYFVCYLSSQTGCNRGCTFCHLTVTGQTSFTDSTHNDFVGQAVQVFRHYRSQRRPARYVHYSFMARGEPLANRVLLDSADSLLVKLGEMARDDNLGVKFNVSSIMPATLHRSLPEVFRLIHPTIYYSLYSADEAWRSRWLPGAMPLDEALRRLRDGTLPRRAAVLTFDDGTRNLATHAAPVLRDLGLPAAVFLATGPMGTGESLWPDRLWLAFARTQVPEVDLTAIGLGKRPLRIPADRKETREEAVQYFKQLPDPERIAGVDWLVGLLGPELDAYGSPFEMLGWDDARELAGDGRVLVGGDPMRALRLAARAPEALARLLEQTGRKAVVAETPASVLHLKTASSIVDEETILATRELAASGVYAGYRVLEIPEGEAAGANVLRVNDTILAGSRFPRILDLLDRHGAQVVTLENQEIEKIDAGFTCMSLRWHAG